MALVPGYAIKSAKRSTWYSPDGDGGFKGTPFPIFVWDTTNEADNAKAGIAVSRDSSERNFKIVSIEEYYFQWIGSQSETKI